MSSSHHTRRSIALSLPVEEQWTLHHVLLDRIEREHAEDSPETDTKTKTKTKTKTEAETRTKTEAETGTGVETTPPAIEVYRAFERLDAGRTDFTPGQLTAMESVLSAYHHSPTEWELDRPEIESLLEQISDAIERDGAARSIESAE